MRVPVTPTEVSEARHRHSTAIMAVVGAEAEYFAFVTSWSGTLPAGIWTPAWNAIVPRGWEGEGWVQELMERATIYVERGRLRGSTIERLCMPMVLDMIDARLAIWSPATGAVYCPYDGGADIVMRSESDTLDAQKLFAEWCV